MNNIYRDWSFLCFPLVITAEDQGNLIFTLTYIDIHRTAAGLKTPKTCAVCTEYLNYKHITNSHDQAVHYQNLFPKPVASSLTRHLAVSE
jgi:hypothetical protein